MNLENAHTTVTPQVLWFGPHPPPPPLPQPLPKSQFSFILSFKVWLLGYPLPPPLPTLPALPVTFHWRGMDTFWNHIFKCPLHLDTPVLLWVKSNINFMETNIETVVKFSFVLNHEKDSILISLARNSYLFLSSLFLSFDLVPSFSNRP